MLVIGQVVDSALLAANASPLTYAETGDLDGSEELYPEELLRLGQQALRSEPPAVCPAESSKRIALRLQTYRERFG